MKHILVGETSWKYPIGRPRKRWDNNKLNSREMCCEDVWN